jgi:hypothetical protein
MLSTRAILSAHVVKQSVEAGDDERASINTKRSEIRARIRRAAACAAARACKYQRKYKRAVCRRGDCGAGTD